MHYNQQHLLHHQPDSPTVRHLSGVAVLVRRRPTLATRSDVGVMHDDADSGRLQADHQRGPAETVVFDVHRLCLVYAFRVRRFGCAAKHARGAVGD